MGRSSKRKHADHPSERFAMLRHLSPPKKRKLSSEASDSMNGHAANGYGDPRRLSRDENSEDWQVVESKAQRENRRRGPGNEKVKYPEVISHGKNNVAIRMADLQGLVLYTLADGVAPNWLAFKHSHHTRKVVALMVPGLELGMFDGTMDLDDGTSQSTSMPSDKKPNDDQPKRHETNRFTQWRDGRPMLGEAQSGSGSPITMNKDTLPPPVKSITDMFSQVWPVKAPGDSKYAKLHSPLQAMLIAPLPASKVDRDHKGPKPPAEETSFRPSRTPITEFILSADELREAEYPIHPAAFTSPSDALLEASRRESTSQSTSHGWVDTSVSETIPILPSEPESGSITQNLTVYAIDCEMVLTSDDVYSLARISVIDWAGSTILDSYVKPTLPIKNYFTQFSGITPAHLENVTTTLANIQTRLLELFTPSTVLLGHSLESDLAAMKLTHPFIVDTSLIYPHPRGPPLRSSLKFLTQKYLRREIQNAGGAGHDSVEDARAVLDLVKLKCEKGPKWGTSEAAGEPIFRRIGRCVGREGKVRTTAIVDYGTPERGYGKEATVAIGCGCDEEIVKGVVRAVNGDPAGEVVKGGGVDFVWARLRELEAFRGWANNNRGYGVVDGLHWEAKDSAGCKRSTNDCDEKDGTNEERTTAVATSIAQGQDGADGASIDRAPGDGEEKHDAEASTMPAKTDGTASDDRNGPKSEPQLEPEREPNPAETSGPAETDATPSSNDDMNPDPAGPNPAPAPSESAEPPKPAHTKDSEHEESDTLARKLATTIAHIHSIYSSLPPCTLFIIYSGTGDPREVGRLQKLQSQYRKEFRVKKWDELSVKWTDVEEQALRRAVERARGGVGFVCVK